MADRILEICNHQAAGDTLVMTCAIRDLKKAYPDKYDIRVITNFSHMWDYNPYLTERTDPADIIIKVGTKIGVQQSNSAGLHICNAYRLSIEDNINLKIPQGPVRPDVHLSEVEKARLPIIEGEYWIIDPGTRKQFTSKIWPYERWQQVVDSCANLTFVQIGMSSGDAPRLQGDNVMDFVGKTEDPDTGIRDLFNLYYHCIGSMGLVSFQMHLAAAFMKPCVVVAGAREPVSFEAYNFHCYIHNQGAMSCGKYNDITRSCWRTSVEGCTNRCSNGTPKCLDMIEPRHVIEGIQSYYIGGRLSPAGEMSTVEPIEDAVTTTSKLLVIPSPKDIEPIDENLVPEAVDLGDPLPQKLDEVDLTKAQESDEVVIQAPVIPVRATIRQHKIFKMVCGAHSFGGGERSALWIMERMAKEGYDIQLVPTKNVSPEFKKYIPFVSVTNELTSPCEILMFYTNDEVYKFNEPKYQLFEQLQAKRKLMVLNYKIGKAGENSLSWVDNWDGYIFLNTTIQQEYLKHKPDTTTFVLSPPVDLRPFLEVNLGSLNKTLHMVRHSSQGDKKFPVELNEMIKGIRSVNTGCKFSFMPAPSFLDSIEGISKFKVNEIPVVDFLKKGTLFWYPLPDGYTDQGPRVIVEALAVGLPVIADNRDGAKDRVIPEVGWLCNTHDEYTNVVKGITGKELTGRSEAAKEYARKAFDPERWVPVLLGGS